MVEKLKNGSNEMRHYLKICKKIGNDFFLNIAEHGISGSEISHYYDNIKESEISSPKFFFRYRYRKTSDDAETLYKTPLPSVLYNVRAYQRCYAQRSFA